MRAAGGLAGQSRRPGIGLCIVFDRLDKRLLKAILIDMADRYSRVQLTEFLRRLGELLPPDDTRESIVVVGGAALNLLGLVDRATVDVDVIAIGTGGPHQPPAAIRVASELSRRLRDALRRLTRDLGLPEGWLNTTVTDRGRFVPPPGFADRIRWTPYGHLWVGIAGRQDLIALKLHAAADTDVQSRHTRDLIALHPSAGELRLAEAWVLTQDAGTGFPSIVAKVVSHVLAHTH